jgi:sulfite reductase (NADPH) flavoprotein alpha-component
MQLSQSATAESSTAAHSTAWSRNNPYAATVLENRLLTGSGSEKETRHIELDLADSGITYLPGDSAGILPVNACDAVDLVLERLQLTGAEPVTDFYGKPLDLRQALTHWLMIGKVNGTTLKAWAKHTGNPELSEIAGNREKLDAYLWGREFLDVLEHAPGKVEDPQQLFKILPRLAPRLYSISSSQALLGRQIDLCIRVVKYNTHGRDRFGVCSTHVGERTPKGGKLPIFIHSNQLFRLPSDPDARVIMVGPGTGVAPFRAYLQHKQAGEGRWPMWLFFGDQRASQDYLYREDFEGWLADGTLNRLDTAFSRDQKDKIYVQTRIREHSAELYRWLADGAYFYVCGDSKRMAPDVEAALLESVATHSGKGPEYANEFLAEMKKGKRYLRDVY